jgi:site-specific recombinase XerD
MLAEKFTERELGDQKHLLLPRSHTTAATYKMYLKRFIRPRWDGQAATKISHHAIQDWLQDLKRGRSLANQTVGHLKGLMAQVYKFGRYYELVPDSCDPCKKVRCESSSEYEPRIISPEESYRVWCELLKKPEGTATAESTLVLLLAATGLRISVCFRQACAIKELDLILGGFADTLFG